MGKTNIGELKTICMVLIHVLKLNWQKEQLSIEISKIDALIMRNVTGMQHLELKLEPVCVHDYHSILLPLVKSYLRVQLEDLAEKDTTEKSDAAREAFLAELELDSKKGIRGRNDNLRHSQEKTKDKKKHKESRKIKDSKAFGGCDQSMLQHKTSGQGSFPLQSDDGEALDSDAAVCEDADELKLKKEEFRLKIVLEAEERKLEETLEYQRRIEEEAKQKHLAEQHKKSAQTYPEEKITNCLMVEFSRIVSHLVIDELEGKVDDQRVLLNFSMEGIIAFDNDVSDLVAGNSQLDNSVKEQDECHDNPLADSGEFQIWSTLLFLYHICLCFDSLRVLLIVKTLCM